MGCVGVIPTKGQKVMTVDFITFCCHKDCDKLYENLDKHIQSHNYNFNKTIVIHQRIPGGYYSIKEEEYPDILLRNGINPCNEEADDYTHGWSASHYWKHHCVNHLKGLELSDADYIVFSDADCFFMGKSWIPEAIDLLKKPKILVVSPGDGTGPRFTQTMSQQLFIIRRKDFMNIDLDLPFEGFKDGGPMQEYYFMLEGRIGRFMEKNDLQRYILEERYWHDQWH